jgi:acyl phosphate:glycerol-3-phosphate acyltransferase
MTKTYFIIATISYLLGSIPFGYILVRLFLKQDIRTSGSGNIGATNVARSGAKGLGIATLVLDAAKGLFAVVIGTQIAIQRYGPYLQTHVDGRPVRFPEPILIGTALAAVFAIIGHCFPVWLKFKGGKGVATAVGVFAVLAPKAVLIALLAFVAVVIVFRFVSLGSVIASAVFPFAAFVLYPGLRLPAVQCLMIAGPALIIFKHHGNIRRLITGTEDRFGAKSA